MNIFVLAYRPRDCARMHADRHVVKMVLETAQILSTAVHLNGFEVDGLYRPTHLNHPCVRWAASSRQAFEWLADLGVCLATEYTHRYGRVHKSSDAITLAWHYGHAIPSGLRAPFVKAMPDEYKRRCPVASYRNYYRHTKTHLHSWTNRARPDWL